jgi:hypothetical protein
MRDSEGQQVSESILGKCLAGEDVRSQFPSQFAILEITPTELRFAGESVLRLENFEIAEAAKVRGQLILPLVDNAENLAESHKWASEAAPCWPQFEGRVLIAAHPDSPFQIIRMSMYTLGQAQFGEFSFWVDSPEVTAMAETNPPNAAWVPPVFTPEPEAEPGPPTPPKSKKTLSPEEQAQNHGWGPGHTHGLGRRFPTPPCRASLTRTTLESGFSLSYRFAPGPENPESKKEDRNQIFAPGPPESQENAVQDWLSSLAINPSVEVDWIDVFWPKIDTQELLGNGSFVLKHLPTAQWVIAGGEMGLPASSQPPTSASPPAEMATALESTPLRPKDWIAVLQSTMPTIGFDTCIGPDGKLYDLMGLLSTQQDLLAEDISLEAIEQALSSSP